MTEDNRREFQTPIGPARLTEEAAREERRGTKDDPELRAAAASLEEWRSQREEEEQAGKANPDNLRRRQGEKKLEEHKRMQRILWKQGGGTDQEFEESWPQIRSDYLKGRTEVAYRNVTSAYD